MTVSMGLPASEDLDQLYQTRRVLRDEMSRVQYWLRLVRARIDLSVAVVLLPDRVADAASDVLPPGDLAFAPDHDRLAQLVRGSSPASDSFAIGELRSLEQQLSRYAHAVRSNLEYATGQLVFRLALDPYSAIAQVPSAR